MAEGARGLVVVILAAALGISVVIFTGAAAWALVSDHLSLSDAQTALVSTLLGGLLGALGTYLGVKTLGNGSSPK
jgi:hypothetical protein